MRLTWLTVALLAMCVMVTVTGCGESEKSKSNRTLSLLNVIVRKNFNPVDFQEGGKTGQVDAWGNEIRWSSDKTRISGYYVEVRSYGPDGLPFTRDDLTARQWVSYRDDMDKARSQANSLARKEFNEKNFPNGGGLGDKDPWGNEFTWRMDKGPWNYGLYVRSNGPDGLPFTADDIEAKVLIPIAKGADDEGVSERFIRGLTRGAVKGIKQGLKDQFVPPAEKK